MVTFGPSGVSLGRGRSELTVVARRTRLENLRGKSLRFDPVTTPVAVAVAAAADALRKRGCGCRRHVRDAREPALLATR